MKTIFSFCLAMLLCVVSFPSGLSAQYYSSPSNTYFKPFKMPQTSQQEVRDYNIGGGRLFTGRIYYTEGAVTSYSGCMKDSNGNEYHGAFNPSFGVLNEGGGYLYIPAAKDIAIQYVMRNGQYQEVGRYNIKGRSYYINGSQIYFPDSNVSTGNYNTGNYNTGSSSSGSSYNRHEAICRGCNGSGRCDFCGGNGWRLVNSVKTKCSRCHGSGTCRSCSGVGKFHGNY